MLLLKEVSTAVGYSVRPMYLCKQMLVRKSMVAISDLNLMLAWHRDDMAPTGRGGEGLYQKNAQKQEEGRSHMVT